MTGEPLDRTGYVLEFDEDFSAPVLDPRRWVEHYLPQWTTPERSQARYDLSPGLLRLRIDADQPAWRLEDGDGLRVSNLQTGVFSGPAGSPYGQSRHRSDLTVVTPQVPQRLVLPTLGDGEELLAEAEMRASDDPAVMLAFWLIGFEERPEDSGELCVAELFGNAVGPGGSTVNTGVKAHHDPRLHDDMESVRLEVDAMRWHTYGVEWAAGRSRFLVDDRVVRTVGQSMPYPMQLLVDLFEFPVDERRDPLDYPKSGEVRSIRVSRRT